MKRFAPGECVSDFRVLAREYGDVQDNLIMGTPTDVFTWIQVEADYTDEVCGVDCGLVWWVTDLGAASSFLNPEYRLQEVFAID